MAVSASRYGGIPAVLLVHGAFTDTSSWAGVLRELTDTDTVADAVAVPNPLRGLAGDAAHVAATAAAPITKLVTRVTRARIGLQEGISAW